MAVRLLEVDLGPGIRAGFSTRHGGASAASWATANLASSVGDDPAAVRSNAADVTGWLGARPVFAHQIHSAVVRRVDLAGQPPAAARCDGQVATWARAHPAPRSGCLSASAATSSPTGSQATSSPATSSPGTLDAVRQSGDRVDTEAVEKPPLGLGVLAADCLPVLFADTAAGVIATAHAGRRGLAAGVLQATVEAMVAAGARRAGIRAVIGPGICGRCYEVPEAMRDEVAALVPQTAASTARGTPALDLPAGARGVLHGLGLRSVVDLEVCTATDGRFYSYRAAGGPDGSTGRFAGVVGFGTGP